MQYELSRYREKGSKLVTESTYLGPVKVLVLILYYDSLVVGRPVRTSDPLARIVQNIIEGTKALECLIRDLFTLPPSPLKPQRACSECLTL